MANFMVLLVLLTGCASSATYLEAPKETGLLAGAEHVEIVNFVSDDRLADYEELKTIECRLGMNYSPAETNVEVCENSLRNEAFENGASIAWVRPEWKKVGTEPSCANCVEMRAMLLAPKQARSQRARRH